MQHATIVTPSLPARRRIERGPQADIEAYYTFRGGEHELQLACPKIQKAMVKAIGEGDAEFALIMEETFLGLCCRFEGAIPWVCSFYEWHDTARADRTSSAATVSGETRVPLDVLLVEERDGPIHASRCITLSLDFSRALVGAIREQARLPVDPIGGHRALARLRRACPTPEALAASATVRSSGNL